MQSRDNHLDRSTAPGFRVLAQPSRSPTPLQQTRPDTLPPPIFLSRCVTKSTHVPFARRSLDGLDHSIPIERLAEGLLQIAVSRTPRPEHSFSPSKFTAPGRSRYSAKDLATVMPYPTLTATQVSTGSAARRPVATTTSAVASRLVVPNPGRSPGAHDPLANRTCAPRRWHRQRSCAAGRGHTSRDV